MHRFDGRRAAARSDEQDRWKRMARDLVRFVSIDPVHPTERRIGTNGTSPILFFVCPPFLRCSVYPVASIPSVPFSLKSSVHLLKHRCVTTFRTPLLYR
jgi:hypothetical protein